MEIRSYTTADREACLALLRSNVPDYFVAADEADYGSFLERLPGRYFVAAGDDGRILAAGGIAAEADGTTATLCWGIVSAAHQRAGIGSRLLTHRLEVFLPEHPGIARLRVNTTQKVQAFFEKHGFVAVEVKPFAYGPDLHHVRMERSRVWP
jgi:GNAT superfamily N-acetyltransferase